MEKIKLWNLMFDNLSDYLPKGSTIVLDERNPEFNKEYVLFSDVEARDAQILRKINELQEMEQKVVKRILLREIKALLLVEEE